MRHLHTTEIAISGVIDARHLDDAIFSTERCLDHPDIEVIVDAERSSQGVSQPMLRLECNHTAPPGHHLGKRQRISANVGTTIYDDQTITMTFTPHVNEPEEQIKLFFIVMRIGK